MSSDAGALGARGLVCALELIRLGLHEGALAKARKL